MRILWAPWRIAYIRLFSSKEDKGCFLCRAASDCRDEENLVVFRGKTCFVILNRYPYNNGHLMVAPYRHTNNFLDLSDEEALEIVNLLKFSIRALREEYGPDGFNIGLNLGKVAGAGLEAHIHFHIVPRWIGDTNFMKVLSDTKVIPESLEDSWRRIKVAFNRLID